MLLALNIGNTNTTAGIFDKERLLGATTVPTGNVTSDSEAEHLIDSLIAQYGIAGRGLIGCAISSVVPDQTAWWALYAKRALFTNPVVISGSMPLGIRIDYDDPATIGADRLCGSIAGFRKYGGPLVLVDFGTATTYTVLDGAGNILGGVIAPGIVTAAQELYRRTAQLPNIGLEAPKHIIGTSTRECMESGIFYAGMDAAEGMIRRLQELSGIGTRVIATGGLGSIVAEHTRLIHVAEPHLVLEGARLIHDRMTAH